jgi:hypothetical protein
MRLKNIEIELDMKHMKVTHERKELELVAKVNQLTSQKIAMEL